VQLLRHRPQLQVPAPPHQHGGEGGGAGRQEGLRVAGGGLGRGRHQRLHAAPRHQAPPPRHPSQQQAALVPGGVGVAVGVAQADGQPVEGGGGQGAVAGRQRRLAHQQQQAVQLNVAAAGGGLGCMRACGGEVYVSMGRREGGVSLQGSAR
jgi:hypothetical protein